MKSKMKGPVTSCPSTRIDGANTVCTSRTSTDSTTGRPTRSPMKTVPRDHSMRASDRSKMRTAAVSSDGA